MKSLYLRIVVIFSVALVCSLVALLALVADTARRATGDFFEATMTLQLQQARRAYETGGATALASLLTETDEALRGRRYLTDATGRDLVSGADRSGLFASRFNDRGPPRQVNGQFVIARESVDKRYRLLVIAPPPMSLVRFLPYFILLALAVALSGWALSLGIVPPLRRMTGAVDAFGKGDLSARVHLQRKDEIGYLGASFNAMADRIETLLTAERRLLQDVSHELRSPLARLSFATELMADSTDSAGSEVAIGRVRREVSRITSLVSTLLEVTSAEGDPATRKRDRIVLNALLDDIVMDCAVEANARGVQIEGEWSAPIAEVEGDAELLRRAIENVLRNAIRYAPRRSAVSCDLTRQGNLAMLTVRDSGAGAPPELLERIFDPFFRADTAREHQGGGHLGLGLSIARRAVLLHGGEIRAESAAPGLQVTIALPTVRAVLAEPQALSVLTSTKIVNAPDKC